MGLSLRQVQHMCQNGVLKSAHKPGMGARAHYRIARAEVISRVLHPLTSKLDY